MNNQTGNGSRTVVKSCRVTLEEDLILRENAQAFGLTMTEFMRSRLLPASWAKEGPGRQTSRSLEAA